MCGNVVWMKLLIASWKYQLIVRGGKWWKINYICRNINFMVKILIVLLEISLAWWKYQFYGGNIFYCA